MNAAIASQVELLEASCTSIVAPAISQGAPAHCISLTQLTTFVVWVCCGAVGLFGFVLPYAHLAKAAQPEALTIEMLNVQLSAMPEIQPESGSSGQPSSTAMVIPSAPQPMAVAEPSAAVAFAIPVENVARITDVRNAAYYQAPANQVAAPAVQQLTFGQGEGRQPAPDYPSRARREGQQGTVVVRLTVGETGSVLAAEAVTPSPWPLLNESAVRTIKNRWAFSGGRPRIYEIPIRFALN